MDLNAIFLGPRPEGLSLANLDLKVIRGTASPAVLPNRGVAQTDGLLGSDIPVFPANKEAASLRPNEAATAFIVI